MQTELNNGVKIPLLGYGSYDMKQPEILNALKAGYRHIDTANGYHNEAEVAAAIKASGISRKSVFITTKVTNGAQREGRVLEEFETSLKNLATDYVDLYLIHWPVKESYVNTWRVLETIYETGRAKAIGVSNFQMHHLDELKKTWRIVPALNQIELHPKLTQSPLITYCQQVGIKVEAWSPLGAGKAAIHEQPQLVKLAKKYGVTPAQIVLRWQIQQDIVTIPRSKDPQRMATNFAIWDFELIPEEMAQISALNEDMRTGPDPDHFTF